MRSFFEPFWRIRTSTRSDKHKLGGAGQTPEVREHTFNKSHQHDFLTFSSKVWQLWCGS